MQQKFPQETVSRNHPLVKATIREKGEDGSLNLKAVNWH